MEKSFLSRSWSGSYLNLCKKNGYWCGSFLSTKLKTDTDYDVHFLVIKIIKFSQ